MNSKKEALITVAQAKSNKFDTADKVLRNASRFAMLALTVAAGAAHAGGGGGGGLDGITSNVQQVVDVVTACGALIAIIGVLVCGYKVTMQGATFQDISHKLLGCGIIGGASGIANAFMGS